MSKPIDRDKFERIAWATRRIDAVGQRRWNRIMASCAESKALGVELRGPPSARLGSYPGNSLPSDNSSRARLKSRITLPKLGRP